MNHKKLVRLTRKSISHSPKLILLLHGYGSNAKDLFSFSVDIPESFLVISLQAPLPISWGGWCWYEINFRNFDKFTNDEQAKDAIKIILSETREICQEYEIPNRDIWLCGFSQGAVLSYALAWNYPKIYSRVLCLSGYLHLPLLNYACEAIEDHKKQKYYISHGLEDVVIPIEWSLAGNEFLVSKGIKTEYHSYKGGHGVSPENFHSMMEFIKHN